MNGGKRMTMQIDRKDWRFPSNDNGQIYGIADSGVETFNGSPITSLAREICQNSLDASDGSQEPVRVEFNAFAIPTNDIPGIDSLQDAFQKGYQFWSIQQSDKARKFYSTAIEATHEMMVTCLRISDFHTTGLTGAKDTYNSAWCNLIKSSGASDKSGTKGGSFGIGKFAPYACSRLRTVLYSTVANDGISAYQGVSRLTSFAQEDGSITQGTGFYGQDKNTPIWESYSLDPDFTRPSDCYGTDVFVVGFHSFAHWEADMIGAILDGFLYAILSGTLVVKVGHQEISKETLPQLIERYTERKIERPDLRKGYADVYYRVLTGDEETCPTFTMTVDKPGMRGELQLRLMISEDLQTCRRVAMIRETGMKILDKDRINGVIPFGGTVYIKGQELNGYLRNLENPQHMEWEVERADRPEEARKLLSSFTKFIKEQLKNLQSEDVQDSLDPAVGELLPALEPGGDEKHQVDHVSDRIRHIEVNKQKPLVTKSRKKGDDPLFEDYEAHKDAKIQQLEGGLGQKRITRQRRQRTVAPTRAGDRQMTAQKRISVIPFKRSRIICLNRKEGIYQIVFVPTVHAQNGMMDVFMVAESSHYRANLLEVDCTGNPNCYMEGNRIRGLTFVKDTPLRITVRIDYKDFCSMEVVAYGNKTKAVSVSSFSKLFR